MKRILCLFLALTVLSGLCGCRKNPEPELSHQEEPVAGKQEHLKISLLYSSGDSLNPYATNSLLNRQLSALLFEPLVRVNSRFEADYRLAETVSLDANTCTAVLKNTVFTDGSPVTADDVVYSFQLAKSSAEYGAMLTEFQSASAVDGRTVSFRLTRYDPYGINLLEFPIMKAGSEKRVDEDGVVLPPIGCGRYVADGKATLKRNENYYGGKSGIATVELINAPDKESVSHYVEVGAADLYFTDLSDGNIVRMSGKRTEVNLNQLVYIGINSASSGLSERYLRYAVSSALDRAELCKTAYYNNAVPAQGFYHPDFAPTKAVQTVKKSADLQIAIENLGKVGYNNADGNGLPCNANGQHLSLTLLVNNDNPSRLSAARMIAAQLRQAGIEITLQERDYASYLAAVSANQFQLYLGEIKILNNMDLSPLTVAGGSAAFGVGAAAEVPPETAVEESTETAEEKPATVGELINGFYGGTKSVSDLAGALLTEMPAIPVCFRKGLLFYSEKLEAVGTATPSDLYCSMNLF